jgi:hypothetical protein
VTVNWTDGLKEHEITSIQALHFNGSLHQFGGKPFWHHYNTTSFLAWVYTEMSFPDPKKVNFVQIF